MIARLAVMIFPLMEVAGIEPEWLSSDPEVVRIYIYCVTLCLGSGDASPVQDRYDKRRPFDVMNVCSLHHFCVLL